MPEGPVASTITSYASFSLENCYIIYNFYLPIKSFIR